MLRVLSLLFILYTLSFSNHTELSLKLSWLHQFQFAGFYVAKEKGFYKEKGLHVNIHEYDGKSTVDDVIKQKYDFGIGKTSLVVEKAKGKDISLLMAIFQHSPSILITTNPDIKTVKDLVHKNIMVTINEINSISLKAMLGVEGLKQSDINIQPHSYNIQDLIDKKTDAMASYISNEPYILEKKNIPYTVLNPEEYGLDFYGDILFSSKEFLKNNPSVSKDFYDASLKGWLYAFENIEEVAKLIYEKYNSQNKSLEHLIYEGKALKKLAFTDKYPFGSISHKRYQEIVDIYKLFKILPSDYKIKDLIDPLGFSKEPVKIGVLAKRGKDTAINRWSHLSKYLNTKLSHYHFSIVPLSFEEIDKAIKEEQIDFVILNTMMYVQMAHRYKVSRIATLQVTCKNYNVNINQFGGAIFTKKESKINSIKDIKNKKFGAVHETSLGGWVAVKEVFDEFNIDEKDLKIKFLNTHDNVVKAVLRGDVEAGIVRTGTLESMAYEKKIDINDIKVLNQKKYENFPHLVSTELYPEWPMAKLYHTDDTIAYKVLSNIIDMNDEKVFLDKDGIHIQSWTIPQDYSKVNQLLKKFKIFPFDKYEISFEDILKTYQIEFFSIIIIFFAIFLALIYTKLSNKYLKDFNQKLEETVKERTKSLKTLNEKLKQLAHTDELTKIDNRRSFFIKLTNYINLAKRNKTPICLLSLDIDNFKKINDNYGHDVGDEVLKLFTSVISNSLRSVDIFGRVGGEEFSICLENVHIKEAEIIAEKLRKKVEESFYVTKTEEHIYFTVSIGLVEFNENLNLEKLIKLADEALYKAKENGRNKIYTVGQNGHTQS